MQDHLGHEQTNRPITDKRRQKPKSPGQKVGYQSDLRLLTASVKWLLISTGPTELRFRDKCPVNGSKVSYNYLLISLISWQLSPAGFICGKRPPEHPTPLLSVGVLSQHPSLSSLKPLLAPKIREKLFLCHLAILFC